MDVYVLLELAVESENERCVLRIVKVHRLPSIVSSEFNRNARQAEFMLNQLMVGGAVSTDVVAQLDNMVATVSVGEAQSSTCAWVGVLCKCAWGLQ